MKRQSAQSVASGKAMRRRDFIKAVASSASFWPLAVRAQQGERLRRIGVLIPAAPDDREFQAHLAAFLQGLQQLGWVFRLPISHPPSISPPPHNNPPPPYPTRP